jgi:hypothetical protein
MRLLPLLRFRNGNGIGTAKIGTETIGIAEIMITVMTGAEAER